MNSFKKTCIAALITAISSPISSLHASALEDAFSEGKASVNARYRYETVDDSVNKDATASTLRTRLGFTTSDKFDLSAHVDFEHITRLGDPEYNSGINGQSQFAKVLDPDASELNQAYLTYKIIDNTNLKLGRQRIILDNARFVGNVGWRQNEQTFDAFRLSSKPAKDFAIDLVNIQQVNTITGGSVSMNSNLLNLSYSAFPGGKLSAYAYLLDYDNAPGDSTSTYGLRYKGAADKLLYTLEYATQSDYADNPSSLSADYLFAELGYKVADDTSVFIAMESLGSDDGIASFQTPLATKHAFNGWADKFLGTPATGLEDTYIKAVSKLGGIKLVAVYHDFGSDTGGIDYGTELDLVAIKKLTKSVKAIVKYASYDADAFSADTKKLWLSLEVDLKQ